MHKKFRIGAREKEIIKNIGMGLLVISSLAAPNLPQVLMPFLKERGRYDFKKTLRRLKKKGLIYLGGEKIELTEKGRQLQKEVELGELKITKPSRWDKTWRLVSYDIPERYKKERDWFRQVLEGLGFKKIQKSLWVNPYECKEEIAVLAQSTRLAPYVIFVRTNYLPNDQKWRRFFKLK